MTYPYRDERYYAPSQWRSQASYTSPQNGYHPSQGYYNQQNQQPVAFPVYPNQSWEPTYGQIHPYRPLGQPISRPDRGRDYLASLTTSVNNLHIQPSTDKPLPRLPPAPLPERQAVATSTYARQSTSATFPTYAESIPPLPTPPAIPPRPVTLPCTPPKSTASPIPKSFTPSFHPHHSGSQDELLRPPELLRPNSDSAIPTSSSARKGKSKADKFQVYDLTLDSDDEGSSSTPQRRRAISDMPHMSPSKVAAPRTPKSSRSPIKPPASPSSPNAVRCSGYTRSGQPCKRVVKSTAPYLLSRELNVDGAGEGSGAMEERYCKDHAGRICQVGGFYWRGAAKSVWIDFDGELARLKTRRDEADD